MKVELQQIHKHFGSVQANEDVSLMVEAGTIHGLLGENGAGKSTLVKILSGFITHDRGTILLNDQPVVMKTPAAAIAAGVGMLHQDPLDFPPLSVLDNFMVGQSGEGLIQRRSALQAFRQLASQFNFSLDANAIVSGLTVGERQQLEILRLLSLGVNTLILDEPTTGISVSQKATLFATLKQLAAQGRSIIFVSHKLEDVEELCDRVTVMRQGRVAGHADVPCPASTLIELMFGKELTPPSKVKTQRSEITLTLQGVTLNSDRLQISLSDLTVHQGEVIGLAGLEGSGQQLLLLLCAGLLASPTGTLTLNGQNLTHQPYATYLQAGVGYLPADRLKDGLIRNLSIQEHVALKASRNRWVIDWQGIAQQTQQAIALFNIRGKPHTKVDRLSGGNQQRTQLALMPIPLNLLLMEHPTRGLDIESIRWVWQQLLTRCEGGTAILFISSDLDEVMQYSDRVMVFSSGHVTPPIPVEELTVEKLGRAIGGKFEDV